MLFRSPVENEKDILFGCPELLGQIRLRPIGATEADDADFEVPIVFFSAFERVNLTPDKPMQRILETQQLYEPGPWPSLDPIMHVGLLRHVLGRAPLVPLFLQGNSTATIPRGMRHLRSRFPNGRADTQPDKGDGSRIYEVNTWLWECGSGLLRTCGAFKGESLCEGKSNLQRNREMRDGH